MKIKKRKVILTSEYPLGDITLMTAAVRDLHRCYPGRFITDVRTPCGELWNHNPWLRHLNSEDADVETLPIGYPLINFSNQVPYHAIHGYIDSLNELLGLEVHATEFKGDIHLSPEEIKRRSAVAELLGAELPYWIIVAGGKHDVPIKWWDTARYQEVVDRFRGRIAFVQVGSLQDHHPLLRGVLDLRGKTTVRQLVHLIHRAQGVLCGVTGAMHLAAAVPMPGKDSPLRPCVVIAGGREPSHWAAYPNHQFIHTMGALPCCDQGGCWKSHVAADVLNGSRKKEGICTNTVGRLARCMDMITAADVERRIELHFDGGRIRYLTGREARLLRASAAFSS